MSDAPVDELTCEKRVNELLRQRLASAETDLSTLRSSCEQLTRERDEARERLLFIRDDYSPFGGRSCPACLYENGKFIRSCQLHQYISAIAGRADDYEARIGRMQPVCNAAINYVEGDGTTEDIFKAAEALTRQLIALSSTHQAGTK